jgi:hypothetical protein
LPPPIHSEYSHYVPPCICDWIPRTEYPRPRRQAQFTPSALAIRNRRTLRGASIDASYPWEYQPYIFIKTPHSIRSLAKTSRITPISVNLRQDIPLLGTHPPAACIIPVGHAPRQSNSPNRNRRLRGHDRTASQAARNNLRQSHLGADSSGPSRFQGRRKPGSPLSIHRIQDGEL